MWYAAPGGCRLMNRLFHYNTASPKPTSADAQGVSLFRRSYYVCQTVFDHITRPAMPLKSAFILFCAVVSAHTLVAQFKNFMLDEQTGGGKFVCEPTIAINPKDRNNIVAGSMRDNVYYTKDGGQTWTNEKLNCPFGVYGADRCSKINGWRKNMERGRVHRIEFSQRAAEGVGHNRRAWKRICQLDAI